MINEKLINESRVGKAEQYCYQLERMRQNHAEGKKEWRSGETVWNVLQKSNMHDSQKYWIIHAWFDIFLQLNNRNVDVVCLYIHVSKLYNFFYIFWVSVPLLFLKFVFITFGFFFSCLMKIESYVMFYMFFLIRQMPLLSPKL